MSATTDTSSNFQFIFDAALADYLKQTGVDLIKYPFAEKLQNCQSADAIIELFQNKANQFKDYRDGNSKLIDCLNPVVKVIHSFSGILGEAAGVVSLLSAYNQITFYVLCIQPPFQAIFLGVDVLLSAAIAVESSYDALVDLFECVTNFLGRLRVYIEIPPTPTMSDIVIKIMVEVLSVIALATKQIKQGRFIAEPSAEKFAKKLLGESEIEDVLQRLDRLTSEEARMTIAQTLQVVYGLVNNMKAVMDGFRVDGKTSTSDIRQALIVMQAMTSEINKIKRHQLQRDIRSWLSPPDPSINHNIAREAHLDGSAAWFMQGRIFEEWKSKGSLLWIYGKPRRSSKTSKRNAILEWPF
ncbi:hypothetical protein BJV74DRAFT_799388 [Russula compacta]|nr:hypothetical protein BJV74DRAFT_799388 [Russula compacta]